MKYKILTLVGTRPEIIRLSEIIKKIDKNFNHILVHTNQNFDVKLKDVFFNNFKLKKPTYYFKKNHTTVSKTIAQILIKTEEVIQKEKPDAFFVLGDTNSCLGAIVAKKYKIPIFHYEAGNRCFDERVPEENNRKIIDHLADINITYSEFASKNLLREGIKADRIVKVGSPLLEVYMANKDKINKSKILTQLKLKKNNYILISYHREENVDNIFKLKSFLKTIQILQKNLNKIIVVSLHPRTRNRINKIDLLKNKKIKFMDPFDYFDYMKLQSLAFLVISDSGSLSEESSILGIKAITLRDSMERQEAMENATILMSTLDHNNLYNSINILLENSFKPNIINDYNEKNISDKICRIISSYIEFINREVWKKS